ncbi:hypothetical protein CBR_g34712 [Chara braunii]|uniref:Uncharacterized protein n=1 Tax=Chara braunii TaxID=69332 RepID=A0A388JYW4_CHABU|nr:hypothetical protein CBR_g34712 [Chara braunii]|eukprot:GBG63011.1 hypothetical protein CBR_g34712 [Chara braunii]
MEGVQGKLRTTVPKSEKYLAWQQELTSNRAIHGRRRTHMQQPKRQELETEKDACRQDFQEDETFDLMRRSLESGQALLKGGLKSCSDIERPVMGVKTTTTQRIKVKQAYSVGAENRRMYSHTEEVVGRKQYESGGACLRRDQGNEWKMGDTPRPQQGQPMATRNSHHQECVDLDIDYAVPRRQQLPYHSGRVSDSQQHVQQDSQRERKQSYRSTPPIDMEMKKGDEEKDRPKERERERRKQIDEKKALDHQVDGRLHPEAADEDEPEVEKKAGENTRQLRERVIKDGRKQLRTSASAVTELKETRYRTRYCDSQQLKANGRGVGGGASAAGTGSAGVGSSSAAAGAAGGLSQGGHMAAEMEADTLFVNVAKRSRRVAERNAREKEPSPPLKKMPKLCVVLSRQDIQEDFLKITGRRYFGKPKKSTLAARGLALCSSLC